MLRLDSTVVLQAVLGGAVATTQPQATVCASDHTSPSTYEGLAPVRTALNSTTDVTILSAPAASTIRDVDYLSIFNRDTASITVTIKYDQSGADTIILTTTIATLETLLYVHGIGWNVLTATGGIKTPGGTVTSVAFTATPSGVFDVSGSPIVTSGTIALSLDNQNANVVLAGPASGAATTPAFRALVVDDGLAYAADGRLTLTSATPVMVSDVTGSTSIFYALYTGNKIALYDGTSWVNTTFTELTNTTTDNTKNPAAVANNSNYDLFVWNDSGTIRLGRGPAWTSDTGRGTGAGTTELERIDGVLVNKIAITNGPSAQRGRYVGTVRSNGSATIDWNLGSVAANGGAAFLYVWNMYNRVLVSAFVGDSTNSWTTNSTTFRSSNNSTSNRVSFVAGQNEDFIFAINNGVANPVDAATASVGLGYDSTSTFIGSPGVQQVTTAVLPCVAMARTAPGLGFHFIQAVEASNGGVNVTGSTFYGDSGVTYIQSGIKVDWRA